MKNIQTKYKLNFKTMKKGLLTLLAASLVFVGCQNYDDQFDDLNAQISALKSQVDGLSSLSGQVSALSGTISGLQAGVAAAQASADAASSAASAIDLSGLSASLATLQTEVDAVQASLATAATASAVAALQVELDALEADLDDLLSTSNIYSTDVTVTNATTLNSALALGNKINVLNATFTVTGWSGMDYAGVQTLVDRLNTVTGNIVYSAFSSTGTEVLWNNLLSAGDITVTQPGGYSFPKLSNAKAISLNDAYTATVTNISLPALTTVTALSTDSTPNTINFTSATNVDLGSLALTPAATLSITTKKDATLDLGSLVAKDASGNYINYTLTLDGPASFTNGSASQGFSSGLPTQTAGLHDGTINLTNVATAAVHNFRGVVNVNAGVKNFTGNNVVTVTATGATDIESYDVTMIRHNNPTNASTTTTNDGIDGSQVNSNDINLSSKAKLTTVKIAGKVGDVTLGSNAALTSIDMTGAEAFDISITSNTSLTSYTSAAKAEDFVFTGNTSMTSLSASHTTTQSVTTDKAATVTITGNTEMTSLTGGFDDVDALTITGNTKLATLAGFTALKDNATSTAANVSIYNNALVADLVRNTMEATSVTAGTTADTGSITTSSGIKDLDDYLNDAVGATTGTVSVWFDTVSKLETQSAYGGAFTDETANLTAPSTTPTKAQAAAGTYTGYYAYVYSDKLVAAGARTGKRDNEILTNTYDVLREGTAQTDIALGANEGLEVIAGGATYTFDQGDTYNGSTVSTVDNLVAYLDNANYTGVADVIAARDGYEKTLITVSYINSTLGAATDGVVSASGNLYLNLGADLENPGTTKYLVANLTADDTPPKVATEIMRVVGADADFTTATVNSTAFYITRNVSGTGQMDRSPLSANVTITPVIDAAETSTTAKLLPTGYDDGTATGAYGSVSNVDGITSSLFSFDVTESIKYGIRVSLKNTGSLAFPSGTGVQITNASNTAIVGNGLVGIGSTKVDQGLLVSGVNITSYVEDTGEAAGSYVTAFTDISAGTAGSAEVAATLNNKTGW